MKIAVFHDRHTVRQAQSFQEIVGYEDDGFVQHGLQTHEFVLHLPPDQGVKRGEGLIGLVVQRAEPVAVSDAHAHPRYSFMAETGEHKFHSFIGVPIIQHRRVVGVLAVRRREKMTPDEAEVTLLRDQLDQMGGCRHEGKSVEKHPAGCEHVGVTPRDGAGVDLLRHVGQADRRLPVGDAGGREQECE